MNTVLDEIVAERASQKDRWEYEHDLNHTAFDWADYRAEYQRRAQYYYIAGDSVSYRANMIKVAALALAELETHDRSRSQATMVDLMEK